LKRTIIVALLLALAGCSTSPPRNINSSCDIFKEKSGWYKATRAAKKRYGTPIHVQLAIIKHESSFKQHARPEREYILGLIPWGRKSSAYGYAQVKDSTWDWYRKKSGHRGADRDNFADAVMFIGWYSNISQRTLGISKWDAYNQYLAYHEGHGGYKRGTYKKKAWLMKKAKRLQADAKRYAAQLHRCEDDLDKGFWLWPF